MPRLAWPFLAKPSPRRAWPSHPLFDWAYWHLARDTSRRVLLGDDPVLKCIAPGQLPPGEPARQVAMSITSPLRGSSFEPWDGDPLAGWHRVTLGVDARAESEAKADPAAAESPDEWCQSVLTKIRDNLLSFSIDGVPVTNEGISVVSVGCSFEVFQTVRGQRLSLAARNWYHICELPRQVVGYRAEGRAARRGESWKGQVQARRDEAFHPYSISGTWSATRRGASNGTDPVLKCIAPGQGRMAIFSAAHPSSRGTATRCGERWEWMLDAESEAKATRRRPSLQ